MEDKNPLLQWDFGTVTRVSRDVWTRWMLQVGANIQKWTYIVGPYHYSKL